MSYQIADEPVETTLAAYVVNPTAPLLAAMVAGSWLSWPWFAFNAIAMGSPTKKKELTLCAIALGGTALFGAIVLALVDAGWIPLGTPFKFAMLAISTWKVAMEQTSSFRLRWHRSGNRGSGRVRSSSCATSRRSGWRTSSLPARKLGTVISSKVRATRS